MQILADATLPHLDIAFPVSFQITYYQSTVDLLSLLPNKNILLCRSTLKVNDSLLEHTNALQYVGTASSGSDHIDRSALLKRGIQLLDAKGSNALAVADYVITTLAFLQEQTSFQEKKAAIIGLGAVGTEVARRLNSLDYDLVYYDPLRALNDPTFQSASLEEVSDCSLICIHANLHRDLPYPSYHLINDDFLRQLHPGTVIINAARGGIVDEAALLRQKNKIVYCTDVFTDEPTINPAVVNYATLCTPHIAGHSKEAKSNAIVLLSKKIHAALSLTTPDFRRYKIPYTQRCFPTNIDWQKWVSFLYSPYPETLALKAAAEASFSPTESLKEPLQGPSKESLKDAFLRLRAAHQNRHDFCRYAAAGHRFEALTGKDLTFI